MQVHALAAALERVGIDRSRLFAEASLDAAQLADMHARISLDEYRRVVRAAYALSGDPAFGLHMGERLTMGSFDVLGHLVEHSSSLRDAIMLSVRYSGIVSEGPRIELEEDGDCAIVKLLLPDEDTLEAQMAAEFGIVALWRMIRGFVGEDASPLRASFRHAPPAHRAAYARFFAGRACFSRPFSGLELERAWLDRAPASPHSDMRDYLLARAELLLAKADRDVSVAERIRRWLAVQPDLARPRLALAARELGTSTRSLRRRLHAEHVQFSALLDEARAVQAKGMLADGSRSVQETAYALGFRTPSAFSRAFKRWTGMAPKDYRPARGT